MRRVARRIGSVLAAATALVTAVAVAPPSNAGAQTGGGPVVLIGIDAEDCGAGGHGPLANYVTLVNSILSNVRNGASGGLLVLGGKAGECAEDFWNALSTAPGLTGGDGVPGEPVTYVSGAALSSQSFAGFEVLVVVGAENDTSGGLTQAENDILAARATEIGAFVNAGGGLFGLDQAGLTNPYRYISSFGVFTSIDMDYSDIDPTAAGTAVGVDNNLDVSAWHNYFTAFPSFLGTLAFVAGSTTNVAAIGGAGVIIPPEDCGNGRDDDNDGLVDAADPDCVPPTTAPGTMPPTTIALPVPTVVPLLPETGSSTGATSLVAAAALLLGIVAMASSRRRRSA